MLSHKQQTNHNMAIDAVEVMGPEQLKDFLIKAAARLDGDDMVEIGDLIARKGHYNAREEMR